MKLTATYQPTTQNTLKIMVLCSNTTYSHLLLTGTLKNKESVIPALFVHEPLADSFHNVQFVQHYCPQVNQNNERVG